jgi:hypothetical protein
VGACDDQDRRPSAVRRSGDPQTATSTLRAPRGQRASASRRRETLHSSQRSRAPDSDRRHLLPTRDERAPSRVIDRWIYTACLCCGLNIDEQEQSRFVYDYSIYQVEYSRNLVFASGAVMDRLFNTVVDRTRSRLDVPTVRTLFGSKGRPHRKPGEELSPRQAVVIEKPRWNLTIFKVHFGLLTLKAYTKGERVLRFEAIRASHQAARLRPNAGQVPPDHHPADRDGRPLHQHARLRRCRLPA